jgi:hypothetical protein
MTANIQQINNCFSEQLAEQLALLISNSDWKYGWKSNHSMGYSHWNKDFTKFGATNGIDVSNRLQHTELQQAWDYLKTNYFPDATLLRCYANAHTFGVEGYPHTDSIRPSDQTIVVYLNKEWRREWGGETIIYNNDNIEHAEMPKFNKGLIFPGNQWHVAKAPSRICPALRMTLMFKISLEKDPIRDTIQEFLMKLDTHNTKHTKNNLMNHLLRTYDLLKKYGFSQNICSAGAMHSIFGTNVFKTKTLDITQRELVEAVIGVNATNLVELFSAIDRPASLEQALIDNSLILNTTSGSTINVDQPTFDSLCAIEALNLYEQSCLTKYTALNAFFLHKRLENDVGRND